MLLDYFLCYGYELGRRLARGYQGANDYMSPLVNQRLELGHQFFFES